MLDPDAIPCEYKEQIITSETRIDKAKIKKMLKLQVPVPGVKLSSDKQRLVRG